MIGFILCEHACPLCICPSRDLYDQFFKHTSLRGIKQGKKKPKEKKLGKSNIALMMQKEQCITEAAWILKVILHSAANNF